MEKGIIAKKVGMTQIFSQEGLLIPVTVLEAGPCIVVQKKTVEKEGYNSVQLGFETAKIKQVNSPKKGHFKKAGVEPLKVLKEFRLKDITNLELGQEIKADVFEAGDRVDISGLSKGKGYQGTIKRYGHKTGPVSHGSKFHRAAGSSSSATTPGKVKKGKKMAGRMGGVKVTVQNLDVVKVDVDKNLLLIKGAVPGNKGTILIVRNTVKVD